jgi:hypothetical protein
MLFIQSARQRLAGQNDVQPSLHVPMVYERVPASPLLWEYRVLNIDTREEALPDETYLNELGTQGWLLINVLEQRVSETGSRIHYHFVRPKEA